MRRKFAALLLAVVMLFGVTGCSEIFGLSKNKISIGLEDAEMFRMAAQKQNMANTASASAADASFCAASGLIIMMGAISLASIIFFLRGLVVLSLIPVLVLVLGLLHSTKRQKGTLVEPL